MFLKEEEKISFSKLDKLKDDEKRGRSGTTEE